ncbi:MAG: CoA transferase [Bacteroidetes bacterium]|nr:CoA transferase [Bacteroidota bacterium]
MTILSLEQALALPHASLRMVQMGWRVIRIESPGMGEERPGDPNRYIGAPVDGAEGISSYFVAPNLGKECMTINLKLPEGRQLLHHLVNALEVDVFMCNTLPARYAALGIDYKSLSGQKPDLIWCGISAMGPGEPSRAGYDPALQALMGFTYLTGEPDGMPVPCGLPIIDLKAGDEAFTQVALALLERGHTGRGKEIHVSMAQCAASWLITALPQLNFPAADPRVLERSGNEHRSFIPSNAYPTLDGFVYLAIGNDSQWDKLAHSPGFESLYRSNRVTNEGRRADKDAIYKEMKAISLGMSTDDFVRHCLGLKLAVAPVQAIPQIAQMDMVQHQAQHTTLPTGQTAWMAPAAYTTDYLKNNGLHLDFPGKLGQDNQTVLAQAGYTPQEIAQMKAQHTI